MTGGGMIPDLRRGFASLFHPSPPKIPLNLPFPKGEELVLPMLLSVDSCLRRGWFVWRNSEGYEKDVPKVTSLDSVSGHGMTVLDRCLSSKEVRHQRHNVPGFIPARESPMSIFQYSPRWMKIKVYQLHNGRGQAPPLHGLTTCRTPNNL